MFYLTTHSTHFIYGCMASDNIVKDHSDSERRNSLSSPYVLLIPLAARNLLYVPAYRHDRTHHGICYRCHYTKSNPIDDHSNISSKKLQKQNFKPLGHYTCMQCGTSHLQKVQENILSRIILATYRKFTVATVRFTQNVTGNIFTHPIYQQVANVTV